MIMSAGQRYRLGAKGRCLRNSPWPQPGLTKPGHPPGAVLNENEGPLQVSMKSNYWQLKSFYGCLLTCSVVIILLDYGRLTASSEDCDRYRMYRVFNRITLVSSKLKFCNCALIEYLIQLSNSSKSSKRFRAFFTHLLCSLASIVIPIGAQIQLSIIYCVVFCCS